MSRLEFFYVLANLICEYKKGTNGGEEEKNCYLKFPNERDFLHLSPSISFPLKGVLLFLKKLIEFSSSNFPCDGGITPPPLKVFAPGLAGTCSVPTTSRTPNGNNFCKGLVGHFLLPLLKATSTVAPSFPGCTSLILPSFQVLRFDFPSSITVTISASATDCATLAPSLVGLWCFLRSTTYSRFQRFQILTDQFRKITPSGEELDISFIFFSGCKFVRDGQNSPPCQQMRRRKRFLCIVWGYIGEKA